jgi:gliding motility-associated-like protein
MKMHWNVLFSLAFLVVNYYVLEGQPVYMGSQISNGITTGGCRVPCVTPGVPGTPGYICDPAGSGDHAVQTINQIITVPGNQYVNITANTQQCDIGTDGLDTGDFLAINGVNVVVGVSNTRVNYQGCFYNQCSTDQDITVTLTVNRRDETIELDWSFSTVDPGGCTPIGTPVTTTFNQIGPICEGDAFLLPTTSNEGISGSWSPMEDNTMTTTYTFTPTGSTCATTASMTVVVNSLQNPVFSLADFCAPTSGSASGIATPGGTFSFDPPPGDGATINASTGVISNAIGGTTYNVKYVTPGPCPGEQIVNVMAIAGPSGTLSGNATLCPGECATFSFNFTSGNEPYTINLTASPPGFPLPPIPGVTASQQFTICYQGGGPFPTFDPSTFTINIPTIFTGSGNLNLTGISDGSGCPGTASGGFSLTLTSGPTATVAGPLTACADMNGNGTFNLSSLENIITGGNGSLSINWYEDMAGTIPISNPSAYITSGGTVYATVMSGSCESAPVAITLIVNTGNVPFVSMICAESGTNNCDLCLTGGATLLEFTFSDGNAYIVTVRDNTSLAEYTGNVSNTIGLSVPVPSSTVFELISIQPTTGCPNFATYGDLVTINIVNAPEIDPLVLAPSCQAITLPPITGNNLSGNQSYFTGPNGTGTMYNVGDMIFASQTLYIFDTNAGCDDEVTFDVTINPLISINEIADITVCLSAVLPPITGTGLSSGVTYNTNPLGTGTNYAPGSTVTQSLTLYVFDPMADPDCLGNAVDLSVTIHPLPTFPTLSPISCTGSSGVVSVISPVGTEFQYQLDGGAPQNGNMFTNISNGSHTIIVTNTMTTCQNTIQFSVSCDCPTPATITLSQLNASLCAGDTLRVNNNTFGGAANIVNITSNGTGSFASTTFNVTPFSFIYAPGLNDFGKTVTITLTTNDPDGNGPCAPETVNFLLTLRDKPTGMISGPTEVCAGRDITLTASGGLNYSWSDGGGSMSQATYTNITVKDTFYVYVTDAFGCKDTVSHVVNIGQISAGRDTAVSYCNVVSTTIDLNTLLTDGVPITGVWKRGQDTIFNYNNFIISDLPLGFTLLNYILEDPLCGRDTANVRVSITSSNNAGMDAQRQFCSETSYWTSITGIIGSFDGNGIWSITPPTNRIRVNLPDLEIISPPIGTYLLRYIIPDNGCGADTSTITIDILPKPDAGPDTTITVCIGANIDLLSLVRASDLSGTISNPNNYPGLSGNTWNTSGLNSGSYSFRYTVISPVSGFLCPDDVVELTINMESVLNAGTDQIGRFCEGQTINLFDYISSTADRGGRFYYQNQIISNGIYTPLGSDVNFVFTYEVGDGVNCPVSRALITLSKESKPAFSLGIANDICAGQCLTLSNTHNIAAGSNLSFTIQNSNGSFRENQNLPSNGNNTIITLCAQANPPFSFNQIPVGDTYTLRLDSILSASGCVFSYMGQVTFSTKALPLKNISPLICREDTFSIGNEVFSVSRPMGTITIPSVISTACDTIAMVSLRFHDQNIGQFITSECDGTRTYSIGDGIFTFSNPIGLATLRSASVFGCDSLVQVEIRYEKQIINGSFTFTTCRDTFVYQGQKYDRLKPAGSVLLVGAAVGGCDSLVNVQINFSTFSISESVNYQCDGSDPILLLNLASHPGPYTIDIDGNTVGQIAGLPFSTPISVGNHTVVVSNAEGCSESISIVVEDRKGPLVALSQSPNLDGTVQITTTAPQNTIYNLSWSPANTLSCNNCPNPIANPSVTTTYTLDYLYGNQCAEQRQITIERLNTEIILPNIFSPNGDGSNDVFFVQFPDKVTGIVKSMSIYDRWGNQVFLTENKPGNAPSEGWNGSFGSQDAIPGVYVYIVEVLIDGKAGIDTYYGDLTLLR